MSGATGRVAGKVALISGAARGQGRSHAVRLAEEGADIIAVDVCGPIENLAYPHSTPADLQETADLVTALGRRIVTAQVDVRDYGAFGNKLHKIPEATWQDIIDVNLSGVWKTVKAVVPHIIVGDRGGSIMLTGSVGSHKALAYTGHYIAAKHGVMGLMRSSPSSWAST